jgi:hypothetical protein
MSTTQGRVRASGCFATGPDAACSAREQKSRCTGAEGPRLQAGVTRDP